MSGYRRRNRRNTQPSTSAGPMPAATTPSETGPAQVAGRRCPFCGQPMAAVSGLLIRPCACRPGSPFLSRACRGDRGKVAA